MANFGRRDIDPEIERAFEVLNWGTGRDVTCGNHLVLVLVWMARGCNPPPASEIPV